MYVSIIFALLLHLIFCFGAEDSEPTCSRFEFDHKLLDSLVRLQISHEAMKEELENMKKELRILSNSDHVPHTNNQGLSGNYIRWGRTTCHGDAELIYKGYAGGSFYTHSGAASNYLCLPEQPQWSNKTSNDNTKNDKGALVYGAEYQMDGNLDFFAGSLHQEDVPCAVCEAPRSSILMIPGRITCYDGWTVEYVGYLTAGRYDHNAASEYACLDDMPEVISGGSDNENGILFYLAEARCGSLKCPPYVDGRVLSCVVCSR